MDFRQIKYFIAVAERRSFTAASEAVRIAQPALSTQIANLEKELGTALFERHPRGVTLTPSGEIFLDYAFRLRDTLSEARDAVLNTVPEPKGMVTLGLPMTTSVALTAPLIEEVRKTYPMIDLRVVEGLSGDIFAWLLDGRLDIGILYADCMPHPFEATLLVEDDLFLIGRPGSAPTLSEEVSFEELCHYYLIHTSSTHSLRKLLDKTARQMAIKLKYTQQLDSIPQIYQLVTRGVGYTILPKIAFLNALPEPGLISAKVVEPALRLQSWLALSPKRESSRASKCIHAVVPEVVGWLIEAGRWPGGHQSH